MRGLVTLLLGIFVTACATSSAPVQIPLPPLSIQKPDSSVKMANFSGVWEGTWSNGLDHILVVEQVTETGAAVLYAWGTAPAFNINQPGYRRERGGFEGNELVLRERADRVVRYQLDGDVMKGSYASGTYYQPVFITMKRRNAQQ